MRSQPPIRLHKGGEATTRLYALNDNQISEQASKTDFSFSYLYVEKKMGAPSILFPKFKGEFQAARSDT